MCAKLHTSRSSELGQWLSVRQVQNLSGETDVYFRITEKIKSIFEYSPINIHIYYPESQVIHMKRLVYVCSHAQYYYHLYLLQLLFRCSHSDKYLTI